MMLQMPRYLVELQLRYGGNKRDAKASFVVDTEGNGEEEVEEGKV